MREFINFHRIVKPNKAISMFKSKYLNILVKYVKMLTHKLKVINLDKC